MLVCTGIVRIPNDLDLTVTKVRSGAILNFKAFSRSDGKKNHTYKLGLYVQEGDVKKWEKDIQPGAIFYIKHGELESYTQEGWKNSIYTVKVHHFHMVPLRVQPAVEGEKNE